MTTAVCPSHAELLWLMCDALDVIEDNGVTIAPVDIAGEPIFKTQ